MEGRCVSMSPIEPGNDLTAGYCTHVDAEGDKLFEWYKGMFNGQTGRGTGRLLGGTGKYQSVKGNHTYSYQSEKIQGDAFNGTGLKLGRYWYAADEL
uniref:Uncharacterized protein n=1 Tax=Eutreptiella gymnastica TaxID=73025 RepID=A0A7S4FKP1_9EUGL